MRLGHVRLAAIVLYTDKHHICTPRSDRRCIQQHLCVHAGTKFCVRVLCVRVLGCVSVFLPGCLSAGLSVCMDADRQQPFVHACMHPYPKVDMSALLHERAKRPLNLNDLYTPIRNFGYHERTSGGQHANASFHEAPQQKPSNPTSSGALNPKP